MIGINSCKRKTPDRESGAFSIPNYKMEGLKSTG